MHKILQSKKYFQLLNGDGYRYSNGLYAQAINMAFWKMYPIDLTYFRFEFQLFKSRFCFRNFSWNVVFLKIWFSIRIFIPINITHKFPTFRQNVMITLCGTIINSHLNRYSFIVLNSNFLCYVEIILLKQYTVSPTS